MSRYYNKRNDMPRQTLKAYEGYYYKLWKNFGCSLCNEGDIYKWESCLLSKGNMNSLYWCVIAMARHWADKHPLELRCLFPVDKPE